MVNAVADFVAAIEAANDPVSLREIASRAVGKLGFSQFAYRAVRVPWNPEVPFYSTNYPQSWARRYTQQDYGSLDPVVIGAGDALLPFEWDADEIGRSATKSQRTFLDEGKEFGICAGITIPIHGRANEFATFTVTTDETHRNIRKQFVSYEALLIPIALHFHVAANKRGGVKKKPALVRLTPRERECLLWTARGKSAWEVGEILRISERTAVFHLTNATRKLGAVNKTHAAAKAAVLGLIG